MSRWFRVYDEMVDDPKVQRLPPPLFKALINLWCLASQNAGNLPSIDSIAFKLRISVDKIRKILTKLQASGLLDGEELSLHPHNWDSRQFKSDQSNERVRRYRERRRNVTPCVTESVTETPPETEYRDRDRDRDRDRVQKERKEDTARAVPAAYAFEAGVIRLKQKDFDQWKNSFSNLDLPAELLSLRQWADDLPPGKWFHAVPNALAKRNREALARKDAAKNGPEFNWKSGIEGVV